MTRGAVSAIAVLAVVAGAAVWMARPKPVPSPSLGSGLSAVACSPGRQCVAVGSGTNRFALETPLSESWDGDAWTILRAESPSSGADSVLEGVACVSSTSCLAVGHRDAPAKSFGAGTTQGLPLASAWDGRGWRSQAIRGPRLAVDSDLHGVACASTTCIAVGDGETRSGGELAFAESWDGTAWKPSPTRNPGAADDSFLDAVTCTSPTFCVAVGHYEYEVREISTRAATLVESWDGTKWRIGRSRNPRGSQDTQLKAVACSSRVMCMAVGFQRLSAGAYSALAERWDGRTWTIERTPSSAGSPDTELRAVACPRPERCFAVGYMQRRSGAVMLAESWNGATWAIQPMPVLAGTADSALNGIDCSSPASCIAVGTYRKRSLLQRAFAVAWDGTAWTTEPTARLPA